MRAILLSISLTAMSLLSACGSKDEANSASTAPVQAAEPAPTSAPAAPVAALPDVGKLEQVSVTAQGSGPTASVAVQEAMKLAILEVNGASIDRSSVAVKFGLDISHAQTAATFRGSAFAEAIAQHSRGVISNFKLVSLTDPTDKSGPYKATITASIAKLTAPTDSKKIKIVVAPLHINASSYEFGDQNIPASKVAADIRQQLVDALTATGRFSVLDRDFGPEVQQELDLVATGQTPSNEMAKLSQTLSADIVWVGTINNFAYTRAAHKLQTSDRQLVSYSGGWSVSQRLLNVTTRQILLSDTIQEQAPTTDPTTLDRGIDVAQSEATMQSAVVTKAIASILTRTFPITVVVKDGTNVVLSQGGLSVKEGARYAMVAMGKELIDPQTQQSLGRLELPCCQVIIDKVTANLAYAHIENPKTPLDAIDPTELQVREELKPRKSAPAESVEQPSKPVRSDATSQTSTAAAQPATPPPEANTNKW
jgi:curli biogenesis system outer membrane secretion channel CsgG